MLRNRGEQVLLVLGIRYCVPFSGTPHRTLSRSTPTTAPSVPLTVPYEYRAHSDLPQCQHGAVSTPRRAGPQFHHSFEGTLAKRSFPVTAQRGYICGAARL